ncbi:MAG: hypothetical protein A2V88_13475 [Elusimicrobia bacterium RBG_16_66_12]|nr:MAG: hypothetical protein A2V88_13475 [Elusimicrobia bacterium RBG_16_66_12]
MKIMKRTVGVVLGGLLCLLPCARLSAADEAKASEKLVIIVNEGSPLPNPCPAKKLKDVFVGTAVFENKVKLLPVNQRDPEIMGLFLKQFVGGSIGTYVSAWVKKLMSQGGSGPANAESTEGVVKIVADTKGAVGYLWRKEFTGSEKGVRELRIAE